MIGDKAIGAKPLGGGGNDELTSPPATGVDTVPLPQGNALVWNYQEDNFTWADAYVDKATPEAVVCMQYQFDPGWSVRWSDLTETWADLLDAGTTWDDFYTAGAEENVYWLTADKLYASDQAVKTDGSKQYYVERRNIDLNDVVESFTTSRWIYAKQLYFHLASQLAAGNAELNEFDIQVGWSDTLMDEPNWLPATTINLQRKPAGGQVKYDFRSTGRYLALRMSFNATGPIRMTGAEIDVEQTHAW